MGFMGRLAWVVVAAAAATACSAPGPGSTGAGLDGMSAATGQPEGTPRPEAPSPSSVPASPTAPSSSPVPAALGSASERPAWLGTRVLAEGPDGYGEVVPTPPELRDRRLPPPEGMNPVVDGGFEAQVMDVPDDVLARSTWSARCPVAREELSYVRLRFWGFDDRPHRGELLVHQDVAADLIDVFAALFDARFPIEQMRVVHPEELDASPTGDGNNTTGFVCRPVRGSSSWSAHARGLAVDVNPFHNPYVRDRLVLPELASAYTDRQQQRPGMIVADGVAVTAFRAIGWSWGGDWTRPLDWMHFSATGG